MSEKLQKVLARSGIASRRKIETWINDGRITVNGKTANIGQRVTAADHIRIDGKTISISEEVETPRIILYHKPVGEICTRSDPEGRPTVYSKLPKLSDGRWVSVGRLDVNTSGLMLFTNDGLLANHLMHPSSTLEREYAVRVHGSVTKEIIHHLTKGVRLDDGDAHFEDIVDSGGRGSNHWFHVVVMEGRNRLVRRLWESQGLEVSRLIRVRFGPIILDASTASGHWRELVLKEFNAIKAISH